MAVFLATDFHVDRLGYERPLNVFRRWVEAPLAIDPACRSFYVRRASDKYMSRSENMWALYAGDAMFVALREGLPTLNGYSAWGPPGWDLANPQGRDYRDRVRDWIQHNRLTEVCELDIEARRTGARGSPRERSGAWGPRARACAGVRGAKPLGVIM